MTSSTESWFLLVWLLEMILWPKAGETIKIDSSIARRQGMFFSFFPKGLPPISSRSRGLWRLILDSEALECQPKNARKFSRNRIVGVDSLSHQVAAQLDKNMAAKVAEMLVGGWDAVPRKHMDRDGKQACISLTGLLHEQIHFDLS